MGKSKSIHNVVIKIDKTTENSTSFCKPSEKNVFGQATSHICTTSLSSLSLANQQLPKAFLKAPTNNSPMGQSQIWWTF
jgi:hypothetical protein